MKKLKILMLHLGYGGVEKQTITMANGLSKYFDIEIVSFYKLLDKPAYNINDRIKVKYLYNGKPNRDDFKKTLKAKKFIKTFQEGIKALKILYLKNKLIKKEILLNDSDIYFSTRTEYGKLLGKYGKKEKIKLTQEHNYIENDKYRKQIQKNYKNLDYVIVINKYQEEMYKEWFKNTNVEIRRVENILNNSSDKNSKLNNNAIIAVGRLDPIKGFSSLIKVMNIALKENPDLKLYLLGDGAEKEKLYQEIKEYQIEKNIIMPGFVSAEEVTKYMLMSDIYIMTSEKECFPMVILEAFNCGLPVISFDILTGPKELVKNDHNGYLIENRNCEAMAIKINSIIHDSKKLKQLSKNAKDDSKKYLIDNIIKKWLKILK